MTCGKGSVGGGGERTKTDFFPEGKNRTEKCV